MTAIKQPIRSISLPRFRETIEGWKLVGEPFDRPLPYEYTLVRLAASGPKTVLSSTNYSSWNNEFGSTATNPAAERSRALNAARRKFISLCGPTAELGTTLAEWRSSVNMIVKRASLLLMAAKALAKRKYLRFFNLLGVRPFKDWRKRTKDAGGMWMEYWMGWAPLIGDIYNAYQVFVTKLPSKTIIGKSFIPINPRKRVKDERYVDSWEELRGFVAARVQADVRVENPNIWLAASLGLLNPFAIAWNVTPFSFLVGWVVNMYDWLNQVTDLEGLSVTKAYHTTFFKGEGSGLIISTAATKYNETHTVNTVRESRVLGLPSVTLQWWTPSQLSLTRGLTAMSLLAQGLGRLRRVDPIIN